MGPSSRPLTRWLCAESLEGRWLLSAPQPPAVDPGVDPRDPVAVEIVETELVEEEGADGDVAIDVTELPSDVLAAFTTRYPGAEIAEVERETEDGQTLYGITAEHDGQEIDATFAPDGRRLEEERFIPAEDLPPAVREELAAAFPGTEIEEAAVVTGADGETTYEVAHADPDGRGRETVLRIASTSAPETPDDGAPGEGDSGAGSSVPPVLAGGSPDLFTSDDPAFGAAAGVEPPDAEEIAAAEAPVEPRPLEQAGEGSEQGAVAPGLGREDVAVPGALTGGDPDRVVAALDALGAGLGASVWLPEVAGALTEVLPIDLAAVEDGLREVLAGVDSLAEQVLAGPATGTGARRLAAGAAVVAGAQFLLLRMRRHKGGPVLVFNGAGATWSWVFGSTTSTRR